MNKIIVIGNLGSDPEMRYTPSGQSVTQFRIASNRRYTTPEGERREETDWFQVSAFGRLGETCNQYLAKGRQVYVEGRVKGRGYTDRDGQPRASLDITATNVHFIGNRSDGDADGGYGDGDGGYGSSRAPAVSGGGGYDDVDDLPF